MPGPGHVVTPVLARGGTLTRFQYGSSRHTLQVLHWQGDGGTGMARTSLAIVTNATGPEFHALDGALPHLSRPLVGVKVAGYIVWSMHALSRGGNDAANGLLNVQNASIGFPWVVGADFNRAPTRLGSTHGRRCIIIWSDDTALRRRIGLFCAIWRWNACECREQ